MTRAYQHAQKLIQNLARSELEQMQKLIAVRLRMLAQEEQGQSHATKEAQRESEKRPRGHIEEKWITSRGKQYGPYRYRRWWEDGTLRSEYLGKVEEEQKKSKKK